MKIGIDARQISHPKRHGLRTYVENLIKAISSVDNKNDYVLYLDAKSTFNLNFLSSNFTIKVLPWHIKYGSTFINDHFFLPYYARKDKVDLIHYPAYPPNLINTTKIVITVHDVIPFMSNKKTIFKKKIQDSVYNRLISSLIKFNYKKSKILITISKKSKNDLIGITKLEKSKIKVTYCGANKNFKKFDLKKIDYNKLRKFNLNGKFILGYEHKNGVRIVEAYNRLSDEIRNSYQTALICQKGKFTPEVQAIVNKTKNADKIVCIPPISEENLILFYNAASLFVFPSFYEGFGLPVVEAMQCGCPVVCSDRGSLPEIAGGAALYIHELDDVEACVVEIKNLIARILTNKKMRSKLIKSGYEQAKKFSWEKTAIETIKVYEKILSICNS